MRRIGWFRTLSAAGLLGLTACPQQTAIWLISGSEPGQPVLGLGKNRDGALLAEVPYVFISPCAGYDGTAGRAVWVLQRAIETAPAPRQAQVGHAPPGYRVAKGPERLQPGCYVASIQGTGHVEFDVLGDRSSVERGTR